MSSLTIAVEAGLLGSLAGVPARSVIQRLAGPAGAHAWCWWLAMHLAMGLLWFVVTLRLVGEGLGWAVPAYLAFVAAGLVLAIIDATTRLLPNRITYPTFAVVTGLLMVASLGLGDLGRFSRALLAAATIGGLFLVVALISPGGLGLGDVRLAPTLGLALGWLSWDAVAVGIVAGFLFGGLAGLSGMLTLGLSRKSPLAFGPWLITGALLGVLAGAEITGWLAATVLGPT